jgi:hypothetical protein
MKKQMLILCFVISLFFSSCLIGHPITIVKPATGKLPPGQAKKVAGDKSAKAYAPGQQKKL